MRKVIYWGNILTEKKQSGFFHCWAGTMQDGYALIEDTTTGEMHPLNHTQFRFVTPPETRAHKNEGTEVVEVLNKIVEKIQLLTEAIEGR